MRSSQGPVISGTMSNVFAVSDGVLSTPRLDRCGVAGIMRGAVIEAAQSTGIEVREGELDPGDIARSAEVFLCNSVFGIWPVHVLGDIAFEVGNLTQSLMNELDVRPR